LAIKNIDEFYDKLEKIWIAKGSPGRPLMDLLKDGAIFEIMYEDKIGPVTVKKEAGDWKGWKGPAGEPIDNRLRYFGDIIDKMAGAKTTDELSKIYVEGTMKGTIKSDVIAPMPKLAMKGYIVMMKKIGLM